MQITWDARKASAIACFSAAGSHSVREFVSSGVTLLLPKQPVRRQPSILYIYIYIYTYMCLLVASPGSPSTLQQAVAINPALRSPSNPGPPCPQNRVPQLPYRSSIKHPIWKPGRATRPERVLNLPLVRAQYGIRRSFSPSWKPRGQDLWATPGYSGLSFWATWRSR